MAAVFEQQVKRWTYDDYNQLDDDRRYEVIAGALLMAPGPDMLHQGWLMEISLRIATFAKQNKLGRIFPAPLDVILDRENVVQPDLVFIDKKNLSIIQQRGIFGAPDLLIEIISAFSVRRDRYDKKELYARFGVREYWIADPANSSIEILVLSAGSYQLHSSAEREGSLTSSVLPGFSFDIAELGQHG